VVATTVSTAVAMVTSTTEAIGAAAPGEGGEMPEWLQAVVGIVGAGASAVALWLDQQMYSRARGCWRPEAEPAMAFQVRL
jgi:hypothetical protein